MPLADAACAPTRRPTRHEKTATEKLKQSFGKLGCPYDVDSIHAAWLGNSLLSSSGVPYNIDGLRSEIGRLLADHASNPSTYAA
jgi:hypothetical protein